MRAARTLCGVAFVALVATRPAEAQTLQGRVLDADAGAAVPQALVRLVAEDGTQVALTVSGLDGSYALSAPAPGIYRVEGERLGYQDYRSAAVDLPRSGATYQVDLLMRAEPIAIRGLEVTARRQEVVEEELESIVGMDMASVRYRPIHRAVIEDHLDRGHDLEDLIRWASMPSLVVLPDDWAGPCFQWRMRTCLPVYLDGVPQRDEIVPLLPLEAVEAIVVIQPNEHVQFRDGGILLYTAGWLRRVPP